MKFLAKIPLIFLFVTISVEAQEITALTYNLRLDLASDGQNRWDNRKEFLNSQIAFYEPDVFGTQEGVPNQLEDMKKGISGYDYVGLGRDGGNQGEHTAVFYNTKRLKLIKHNTFWLSTTPDKSTMGWDAGYKRICTYALFETKESHNRFWVFNTHLDNTGVQARKNGTDMVLAKIKEMSVDGVPIILTGDFNMEPDNPNIQKIASIMKDTQILAGDKAFGPKGTFNGFKYDEPVTRKIDYIFLSKSGFKVLKYAVLSASKDLRFPSDHFPVYVQLRFTDN